MTGCWNPCLGQEFKEAARLAAEVKGCISEAEACDQRAANAQESAAAAEAEHAAHSAAVAQEQAAIAGAARAVALAQWRRLQVRACMSSTGVVPVAMAVMAASLF